MADLSNLREQPTEAAVPAKEFRMYLAGTIPSNKTPLRVALPGIVLFRDGRVAPVTPCEFKGTEAQLVEIAGTCLGDAFRVAAEADNLSEEERAESRKLCQGLFEPVVGEVDRCVPLSYDELAAVLLWVCGHSDIWPMNEEPDFARKLGEAMIARAQEAPIA